MKVLAMLFALALSCAAQNVTKRGEEVFAKTCATGYCHGVRGQSSGAPRLAGRGFNQAYITKVVAQGIPGTGMPAFATTLSEGDFLEVTAYVGTLNGIANSLPEFYKALEKAADLTGEAARGAKLFKEAVRGFGRCSTCHEVGGLGISVAEPIVHVPDSVAALKALAAPNVKTGAMNGESMPVLVLSDGKQSTLFYDLTSSPPVERNAQPGTVKFTDGTNWRHSSVIGAYNDSELAAILAYLREVIHEQR
jgi:mono/diheme cytochrome c family protein